MTSRKFLDFIVKHELVTYLTLIPSFALTMLSLSIDQSVSYISIGIFAVHIILVLVGTFVMYRKHSLGKSVEFTRKLGVFVDEFTDKITNPTYSYSLPSFALKVARSKTVLEKTQAWEQFLSKLSEELTNRICILEETIKKSNGKNFPSLLKEFCHTLTLLRKFKMRFYKMIDEYGRIQFATDFAKDSQTENRFKRLSKEYNGYMNRLRDFSDDLKAEMSMKLDDKLLEHICSAEDIWSARKLLQ